MAKKKDVEHVDYDVNMRVTLMAKLNEKDAYWCAPALQKNGPSAGKLVTYLWADGMGFKLPDQIKIKIDYPFDQPFVDILSLTKTSKWKKDDGTEHVETYRSDSIGDLLWLGAQAYVKAFKWAKDNEIGYWHSIGDLVFEGMTVYKDGNIEFSVGS
jgi:hypothetical protein